MTLDKSNKTIREYAKEVNRKDHIELSNRLEYPWGVHTTLVNYNCYKIRELEIIPGGKLGTKLHYHRNEYWVVIKGTARIVLGDKEHYLNENDFLNIPKCMKYRLENPGKIPLKIIEVQTGDFIDDSDEVRFGDAYPQYY